MGYKNNSILVLYFFVLSTHFQALSVHSSGRDFFHFADIEIAQFKQDDEITQAAFLYEDTIVATASANGILRFWDAFTGAFISQNECRLVTINPAGTRIAQVNHQNEVVIFDTVDGNVVARISQHHSIPTSLVYGSEGLFLVTYVDNSIKVWRHEDKPLLIKPIYEIKSASFNSVGDIVVKYARGKIEGIFNLHDGSLFHEIHGSTKNEQKTYRNSNNKKKLLTAENSATIYREALAPLELKKAAEDEKISREYSMRDYLNDVKGFLISSDYCEKNYASFLKFLAVQYKTSEQVTGIRARHRFVELSEASRDFISEHIKGYPAKFEWHETRN